MVLDANAVTLPIMHYGQNREIYSNVKDIVEQQKYVFESFWNKAIPAEHRKLYRKCKCGVPDFYYRNV
jgi:hypothetical protein